MIPFLLVATKESAIRNIEGFDKSKLRPADTTEKQELPNTDGRLYTFKKFSSTVLAYPQLLTGGKFTKKTWEFSSKEQ